jgi:hypothetical protein
MAQMQQLPLQYSLETEDELINKLASKGLKGA